MSTKPRTVNRTTTKTKATTESVGATQQPQKKGTTRKPFVDRNNSPEGKGRTPQPYGVAKGPTKTALTKPSSVLSVVEDNDREPIKAYLRIRPQLEKEDNEAPYLEPLSSTTVRMFDTSSSQSKPRLSSIPPQPSVYTFSHIFPPLVSQSEFFARTTLPLVKDVLEGQNSLLFAYGVTNSGKTYTMQGGSEEGSAGILPRTLDVIFNSVEGLQGDGRFRPVRLEGIEANAPSLSSSQSSQYFDTSFVDGSALADVLLDLPPTDPDTDPTSLKLDRNHEYTIWLSYVEIYNEKVYDLFASVDDPDGISSSQSQSSGIPRPTSTFLHLPVLAPHSKPLLLTRKALPVKPCPASDNDEDSASAGKYVAGLRQLRATSAAQAKSLLRLGHMHRQVFGTLANSQSSRSHAMVTIKVLRVHKGDKNDPTSIQTSRLTLVDLAGSERTKHTHTSGDRLREAGNINKSLMVLGQCMETMRANQRALARSLDMAVKNASSRLDTRDVKKSLAVVPFRHSKLTEVLMDYFVGEGRVAMIVNVNPYDTGFDENSHVMKFAAIAREVATTAPVAVARAIPVMPQSAMPKSRSHVGAGKLSEAIPHRRKVTISTGGNGHAPNETHLEVLEEDEEPGDEDDDGNEDDEPINPLVDALFDEIEALRMQLFESELRCVVIEAKTREEVVYEMEERMRQMENMYTRRLMQEVEQHEMKMDAKIDMLQRSGMLRGGLTPRDKDVSSTAEELDNISEEGENNSELADDDGNGFDVSGEPSLSPLAGKGSARMGPFLAPRGSQSTDYDTPENTQYSDDIGPASMRTMSQSQSTDEIEDWPSPPQPEGIYPILKAKAKVKASATRRSTRSARSSSRSLANIVEKTQALTLEDEDDSVIIIPNKEARQKAVAHAGPDAEYVPQKGETDSGKRKKRQLNKQAIVTEDEIEEALLGSSSQEGTRPLRRSTRSRA